MVPDLPVPGLPKHITLALVTGMSSRRTSPMGSKWNAEPDSTSMPIWAPVGGSPGPAMNGQKTGAWSEVIR